MPTNIAGTDGQGNAVDIHLTGDVEGMNPGEWRVVIDLGGGSVTVINKWKGAECSGSGQVVLFNNPEATVTHRWDLHDGSDPVNAAGTIGKVEIFYHKNGRKEA